MLRNFHPEAQGISLYPLTASRREVLTSSVPTLLAVSHSIEQTVMQHHLDGVFYAGFQRMSAFLPQAARFRTLASRCRKVYIFGYPDAPTPDIPNLEYIYLKENAPLVSEWFIIFYHSKFSAGLLTRQVGEVVSATVRSNEFGRGRLYQGLTTFENTIIQPAAKILSRVAGEPEPEFISTGLQTPSSTYAQEFSGYMEQANGRVLALYHTLDERTKTLERMETIVRTMISRQAWNDASELLAGQASPAASNRQQLTILFTDIEGFTRMFSYVNIDLLTNLLNRYFTLLSTVIYQNHGDVDKFLGDGMLAFFTQPGDAVKAARQIQARLQNFNSQQAAHLGLRLNTRIGIATGECVVTRIGSVDRRETTVIGDAVNLASRLQAFTPSGGVGMDETTYQAVDLPMDFYGREINVKGLGPTRIYTLDALPQPETETGSGAGEA